MDKLEVRVRGPTVVLFCGASACGWRRAGEGEVSGGIPGGHRVRGHLLGPERDGEVLNSVDQEVSVLPGMDRPAATMPATMPTSALRGLSRHKAL